MAIDKLNICGLYESLLKLLEISATLQRSLKKGGLMKYSFDSGILLAKHRIRSVILTAIASAFALSIGLSGAVSAAPAFGLQPFEFVGTAAQCGVAGSDTVTAEWDNSTGAPAPSIKLQKLGATSNCAAAGVDIITSLEGGAVSGITELNFEYRNDGHCGGGAPRFNLELNGNNNAFLGCNSVLGTSTPSTTPGWTHVEFDQADILAAVAAAGGLPTDELTDLYIIFDEGTDTGPDFSGTVFIDNISVNNQVVGSPTSAGSKDDCKNGGWKNLLHSNGQAFKNQGECVSSASHNNGHGKDDVKLNI